MNIETGQIVQLTDEEKNRAAARGEKLVAIEESLMTEQQRASGRVSLTDTNSPLGKILQEQRSKYVPHVGAKQLAKAAARAAQT